jgi:hypothetical protein
MNLIVLIISFFLVLSLEKVTVLGMVLNPVPAMTAPTPTLL